MQMTYAKIIIIYISTKYFYKKKYKAWHNGALETLKCATLAQRTAR